MNKKGQAEIFGLVIVMILLIFALLFFIKVKQDDSSNVSLRSNFRANNLLNAIVNLNYENVDMKEMLKACSRSGDGSIECIGSVDANGKIIGVKPYLEEIFDRVLLPAEKYEFEIEGIEPFNHKGECLEGITASPARLPGSYGFKLKLCY